MALIIPLLWQIIGGMTTSDIALFVTCGVLAWTAFETLRLRRATNRANEIQQSPFFVLIYERDKPLVLKNEGRGMAYNVKIEPIIIKNKKFKFNLYAPWYYCEAGLERKLEMSVQDGSSTTTSMSVDSLRYAMREFSIETVEFIIRFNSQLKNDYQQKIVFKVDSDFCVEILNYQR
jgi:hypothetical protein